MNKNNIRDIKNSTVTINQSNSTNLTRISDQYAPEMYCSRKKDFSITSNRIALAVALMADFVTISTIIPNTKSILNFLNNLLHKDIDFGILMLLYAALFFILYFITSSIGDRLSTLKKTGIYHTYYSLGNDVYQLIPKKCPKCHAQIHIKNTDGTIKFCCPRSDNHSKSLDITELDDLPLIK